MKVAPLPRHLIFLDQSLHCVECLLGKPDEKNGFNLRRVGVVFASF